MKKYFNNLVLLLFISIFIGSCTEKAVPPAPSPFAIFEMSKDGGVPPFEMIFTNKSANTDTYLWDFGDNTPTSTEKNPKHTYTASGTYTVTLTATGKGGSTKAQQSVFIDKPISRIFLTSIVVEKIPFARVNGLRWDATSGPDLFITITSPLSTSKPNLYTQPNELWFRDIEFPAFLPVKIVLDTPLELVGFSNDFSVNILDNDNAEVNEYMGNITFKFSDYTTGTNPYPTTIRKINGDYTVSLIVRWSK